jgi:predicted nuclease of restriction endonuclease-like (RecB) superfamily
MPRAPKKPSAADPAASQGQAVSADDSRLARGRTREGARFTAAPSLAHLPEAYAATLEEIKRHLQQARVRAVLAANPIVIEAYWQTGKIILARQQEAAWGAKIIDRLAADLQAEFPDMRGLTRRNLFSMRAFAEAFPNGSIVKQPVSQLPWGHLIRLIQMVKDPAARDFYIQQTVANGWSRSIMQLQIEQQLHLRLGQAQNNFPATLPPADSDLATQIFKVHSSTSTEPPWTTSCTTRTTSPPSASYCAKAKTASSSSTPCAASINPSPSPPGKPSSPNPCPMNSKAACRPSRRSRRNWLANSCPTDPWKPLPIRRGQSKLSHHETARPLPPLRPLDR